MDKPLISVVIPCYNYGHLLERAVSSAFIQEGDNFEVLVVNDGSGDNTEEVVKQLQVTYPELRYVFQENGGAAAARNHGVKDALGDYLVFLDADDELDGGALKSVSDLVCESPSVKVIVGGHTSISENNIQKYHSVDYVADDGYQRFVDYLEKRLALSNGAVFFHKDVFEKIQYPEDCRNSEDIPVFAQAVGLYETYSLDVSLARIYKHKDSLRHNLKFAVEVGETLVARVFDPKIVPEEFFSVRKVFYSQRCLSLFRSFYIAKEYKKAREYYLKSLVNYPCSIFKLSYLRKYIKIIFR